MTRKPLLSRFFAFTLAASFAAGLVAQPALAQESAPPKKEQGETDPPKFPERPDIPINKPLSEYTGDEPIPEAPHPGEQRELYNYWRAHVAKIKAAQRQREMALAPKLTFIDGTERKLGKIYDHQKQTITYRFRNDGGSPLEVQGVIPSCGCTVSNFVGRSYEPGEEGEIVVEFDPSNRTGQQFKYVSVRSTDPLYGEKRLRFSAEVEQLITIEPPFITEPRLVKGKPMETMVWVYGRTDDFEASLKPDTNPRWLTIEKKETELRTWMGEERRATRFEIKVSPDIPMGRNSVNLVVSTNDKRAGTPNLPMVVGVVGDLAYRPLRINFGTFTIGEEVERTFDVFSRSQSDFEIREVQVVGTLRDSFLGYDVAPSMEGSKNSYRITVRFNKNSVGNLQGNMLIKTNVADQPEVRVPYLGYTKGRPFDTGGEGGGIKPIVAPKRGGSGG
ncbi:MAG: DUF1573 domain-containing protein [Planctomycetota bacterium]